MDEPGEALTETKPVRWRRRLSILFVFIIALAAGAFLGVRHEEDHWKPLYNRATTEVAHWKSESAQWQADAKNWQESTDRYQTQLQAIQDKVTATVGNLNKPQFVLWNSCGSGPSAGCPLRPGHEYVGGVPDTFTYYPSFHATVPVTLWIMTTDNFVCWETHQCAWHGWGWKNRTDVDGVFHSAEGCAGYLAVFYSNQTGTLYPSVSIERRPARHPTGACR